MSNTCPYCHATYVSTYPPMDLSTRQQTIYDHVARSGPRGATVSELLDTVYGSDRPESAWGILRVNIFEINRKIKTRGQRIDGRRGWGYFLRDAGTHSPLSPLGERGESEAED